MSTLHERGDRNAIAALIFVCLNASLIQTIVLPIQSNLPQLIGAPQVQTTWVVTAAIGAGCASAPISGRLGDIHGRRRVSAILLMVLVFGSVVAALAPAVGLLVAARALQGLAIGLIPLSVAILKTAVSPERLPGSLGMVSGAMGIGTAFGFPLGASLTAIWGWQSMFWFSAITGSLALAWTMAAVPGDKGAGRTTFDWIGAFGTFTGSTGIIIGIGGPFTEQSQPMQVVAAGAGIMLLTGAILHMLRSRAPLIDIRAATRDEVIIANLISYLLNFGVMSTLVIFPQLLNTVETPVVTIGLIMMAGGLSQAFGAPSLILLTRQKSIEAIKLFGSAATTVGIGIVILFGSNSWAILCANMVLGLGFGATFAAVPRIVMAFTPPDRIAAANGLNAQIRMFGTASAAALIGTLMSQMQPNLVSPAPTALILALATTVAATGLSLKLHRRAQVPGEIS